MINLNELLKAGWHTRSRDPYERKNETARDRSRAVLQDLLACGP
jgi:hypothetical protein